MDDTILILALLAAVGALVYLLLKPPPPKKRIPKPIHEKIKEKIPEPINCQLMLLLDTTHSMGGEIEKCQKNLMRLVGMINGMVKSPDGQEFIKLEIGFVPYKDKHKDGTCDQGHLEGFQTFTDDAQSVQKKIAACEASGGNDLPEDICGGVEKALEFAWKNDANAMKVICIMADDPCHGTQFNTHDDGFEFGMHDDFPEDSHLMVAALQKLVDNRVSLLLSKITDRTDKMSAEFKKFYEQNKPPKANGGFGISYKEFDLNRDLTDEKFTQQIFGTFAKLFQGNMTPEMQEKMKAMMGGLKDKMGGAKKKD